MPVTSPNNGLVKPLRIDTAWFLKRIAEKGSQRSLAQAMRQRDGKPVEPASLNRLLHGQRLMQLHEARQMADLLEVPLADVLRHAGIRVRDEADDLEKRYAAACKMVRTLLGFIDEAGLAVPKRVREQAESIG